MPGAAPRPAGRPLGTRSPVEGTCAGSGGGERVRGPAVDGGCGAAGLGPGRRWPGLRPCRALGRRGESGAGRVPPPAPCEPRAAPRWERGRRLSEPGQVRGLSPECSPRVLGKRGESAVPLRRECALPKDITGIWYGAAFQAVPAWSLAPLCRWDRSLRLAGDGCKVKLLADF